MPSSPTHIRSLSSAIIAWQRQQGRHDLPWQNTIDAYRIWLSEIMLQQTQVSAVLGYYDRFLQRFPTIDALAAASQDEVMALWAGLGYYTRARNLHACAQQVVSRFNGQFPADPQLVQSLPGIGRSTAAAICAFAYGTRAAILDGNVKRVLCRVFAVPGFPNQPKVEKQLWQLAQEQLPNAPTSHQDMIAYTQGLMDLGATVCTRSSPQCSGCPAQAICQAYATGQTQTLPWPKERKETTFKITHWLIAQHQDQVWLLKRPNKGIWGGLWALPELAPAVQGAPQLLLNAHVVFKPTSTKNLNTEQQALQVLRNQVNQQWLRQQVHAWLRGDEHTSLNPSVDLMPLEPVRHAFTHYNLLVQPWLLKGVDWSTWSTSPTTNDTQQWVSASQFDQLPAHNIGLPVPVQTALQRLSGNVQASLPL